MSPCWDVFSPDDRGLTRSSDAISNIYNLQSSPQLRGYVERVLCWTLAEDIILDGKKRIGNSVLFTKGPFKIIAERESEILLMRFGSH